MVGLRELRCIVRENNEEEQLQRGTQMDECTACSGLCRGRAENNNGAVAWCQWGWGGVGGTGGVRRGGLGEVGGVSEWGVGLRVGGSTMTYIDSCLLSCPLLSNTFSSNDSMLHTALLHTPHSTLHTAHGTLHNAPHYTALFFKQPSRAVSAEYNVGSDKQSAED